MVNVTAAAGLVPAVITIDRPQKANALDADTVAGLHEAVRAAVAHGSAFALTGSGKAFCGGFDFTDFERQSEGDLLLRFVRIELLLQAVSEAPVVSFALVNGPAYGAGADLVAACSYRIGTSRSAFRFPGFRFGVALGTRRLARVVGADHARSILLEDRTLSADEALDMGLLTHLVNESELLTTAARLTSLSASLSRHAAADLLRLAGVDTSDADLSDLVRSLCPEGLHARMREYRSRQR